MVVPRNECGREHAFYVILCQVENRIFITVLLKIFFLKTISPLSTASVNQFLLFFKKIFYCFLKNTFPISHWLRVTLNRSQPSIHQGSPRHPLIICRMRITCELEVSIFRLSDAVLQPGVIVELPLCSKYSFQTSLNWR